MITTEADFKKRVDEATKLIQEISDYAKDNSIEYKIGFPKYIIPKKEVFGSFESISSKTIESNLKFYWMTLYAIRWFSKTFKLWGAPERIIIKFCYVCCAVVMEEIITTVFKERRGKSIPACLYNAHLLGYLNLKQYKSLYFIWIRRNDLHVNNLNESLHGSDILNSTKLKSDYYSFIVGINNIDKKHKDIRKEAKKREHELISKESDIPEEFKV